MLLTFEFLMENEKRQLLTFITFIATVKRNAKLRHTSSRSYNDPILQRAT